MPRPARAPPRPPPASGPHRPSTLSPSASFSLAHQPAQRPQVARVPRIDVALAPALRRIELGRLEQHRQAREARIRQQPPERFEAETALADVLVPIDTAAARFLRVVQVKDLDPVEADDPIERLEGLPVPLFGGDIVSRRQQVAGVEAHANPRRPVEQFEDRGEVLEAVAEIGALPGGVLEEYQRSGAAP